MLSTSLLLSILIAAEPKEIPLWGDKIPGPTSKDAKNIPTLTIHLADKPNGTAVVVCPGGGYSGRATDHEGKQIANWLNERGVNAFVLKYRTATESQITPPLEPGPMFDVQQAIRTVRARSKDWGVDPQRVGVWGFSAGGHLASTAATHFDYGGKGAKEEIDRYSCRPDFAILAYPVISMDPAVTHGGSRRNLLGNSPDEKRVEFYSNDKQVTKNTPPTFLFHTKEDTAVKIKNSELFYEACKKQGVPAELFVVEKGRHGVGLGNDARSAKESPEVAKWPEKLEEWLKSQKLLEKK
jgi:acetyl esterase/lipase